MAEGADDNSKSSADNSWWGSWGQGWIDTMKEKSATTLEMVKKDLNEFVEVIQGDTSTAISETANKLDDHLEKNENISKSNEDKDSLNPQEIMKHGVKGISQVLHSLSDMMTIQQEPDDSNEEFITLTDDKFSLQSYNRKQEKIHNLQKDAGTYCNEPEGPYNDWLQVFTLDEHKEEMSNLLIQNTPLRSLYSQLVPNVVSHTTFWQRYYYQVFIVESEERKREELLARATNITSPKEDIEGNEGDGWSDEDDIEVLTDNDKVSNSKSPLQEKIQRDNVNETFITNEKVEESDKGPKGAQKPDGIPNLQDAVNDTTTVDISIETPIQQTETQNVTDKHPSTPPEQTNIENTCTEKQECSFDIITSDRAFKITDSDQTDHPSFTKDSQVKPENPTFNQPSSKLLIDSNPKGDISETASVSSWLSIDDDNIKVKKVKGEQVIKDDGTTPSSDSSSSSGVLVNKSEADELDDDDFDIDLDVDDVNEEELAKMVADIKTKSATGTLGDDDDDWENWE